jgi:hypothetical protein
VLFTLCLALFSGGLLEQAEATYAVPGLQKDKMYDVNGHNPTSLKYIGDWNLQIVKDGSSVGHNVGKSSALFKTDTAGVYNFVRNHGSIPTQLVRDMGGEPSWVSSNRPTNYLLNSQSVFHIRELAKKCGASVRDAPNYVFIYPTEPPTNLRINAPSTIRVNESVNIQFSANSNVPPQSGTKALTWVLTVDGRQYNGNSPNNLNSTQSHTFTSSGTKTITLRATDTIGRSSQTSITVTVQATSLPPPPPNSGPGPPVADFTMPSTASVNADVSIMCTSYSPSGLSFTRSWSVSPNNYTGTLSGASSTIKFPDTGNYEVKLTVTDSKGASDSRTKYIVVEDDTSPPPEPVNLPPVAKINIPSEILQGDDINVKCTSYDPDGEVVRRTWSVTPNVSVFGTLEGKESQIYFDKEGTYTITLEVEDNLGLTDRTSKEVTVKPALPNAFFKDGGTLKQNRKVLLTETGTSASRYPIVTARNEWKIEPVSGGAAAGSIKIGGTSAPKEQHVLFKTPGIYKVSLRVENTIGHKSEWYTRNLNIIEDTPLVAGFFVQSVFLRNPAQGNLARLQISDMSYSDDGDIISQRIWRYKFDSNNDGSFNDESWVIFSNTNETTPYVDVPKVGKYMFELDIVETFGEETMGDFITPADTRTANTLGKPLGEKRTEVVNSRPTVAFDAFQKKKADIVFAIGDIEPGKVANLQGLINQYLVAGLNNHNVDYGTIQVKTATADDILKNPLWREDALRFLVSISEPKLTRSELYQNLISMDSSFSGNYGVSGGNHADGGFNARNPPAYFFAKNRYIDIGKTINKKDIGKITFSVIGWDSLEPGDFYFYVSENRTNWVQVSNWVQVHTVPTTYGISSHFFTVQGSNLPIENIRYFRGFHSLVIDNLLVNIEFSGGKLLASNPSLMLENALNQRLNLLIMSDLNSKPEAEDFIRRNDNNGIWTSTDNVEASMQQITSYILSKINNNYTAINNYVLLNEEVYYKTYYDDYESDPKFAERWIYDHNHTYFENSLGQAPYHNQYIPGPVHRFDQVGYFKTLFAARDNPVATDNRFDEYRLWSYMPADHLDLYVHRRPVGTFTFQLIPSGNNYNITFPVVDAYDLDHLSKPGKGITEHKWQWRLAGSDTWNSGQPYVLERDQDYLVRYQVTDLEGVQSYPQVRLVTTRNYNLPPVAQFTVTPNPVVVNKPFQITDTSYDPNGTPITIREWRVRPPGGTFTSSPKPSTFNQVGTYTIELKVSDGGLWSEPFYQDVDVIPDNNPPVAEFAINHPTPCYDYSTVTYIDTSWDPDGDPIEAREWRISKNGGPWVNYINPPATFDSPGLGPGSYRIQLRVQDKPRLPQLEAKWSAWAERTLTVADRFIVEGTVIPQPGERGRDIKITGLAKNPSTGALTSIDSMEVHIVIDNMPAGMPIHIGAMEEKSLGRWEYVHRVPEKVQSGKWPDDGFYTIRIIGRKSGTVKDDYIPIEINGHILDRVIIRTYRW